MPITFAPGEAKPKDFPLVRLPEIGTYTVGAYYCYPKGYEGDQNPDLWRDDWMSWVTAILQPHIDRWQDFIRHYGLPSNASVSFVEKAAVDAVPYEYDQWYKIHQACKKDARFNEPSLVVACHVWALYVISCSFGRYVQCRANFLEEENLRFDGEHPYSEMVGDTLAHEWGHSFGPTAHCNAPSHTCIMSNNNMLITRTEWLARGEILWFCDDCRNLILHNWSQGVYA